MATATATPTGVELSSLELNQAITLIRKERARTKAAPSETLLEKDVPQNVSQKITKVIGAHTAYKVRFDAWETVEAHFVELIDGNWKLEESKDVKAYSVTLPNTKMKAGYTAYVVVEDKNDECDPFSTSTAFVVVPAMWRRVLCMPNSRSSTGPVSAWIRQWRKHSWKSKNGHTRAVDNVLELEAYLK